ncbi:TetR/AcrR family transcriptional regulator [Streptomyces sp. NRRL WC-3742]|uniref:TetR/AcrR family transcriptional regulator n=1 Tax=Streptomyces sp. NRRL WC-3742 TaxID=1463934 RepID=UPI0004C6EE65|nr:TetR/AcrR family transcriptional regulator [Streptomyces sp. NRRL WC-3742]
MPRPPLHDEASLLDAAVRLAAAGGPPAVTMSAVARESGAPNGSVYHRFPQRFALLAELWLRTVGEFHAAYLPVLEEHTDPHLAAGAAARQVVTWSRAHRERALVLLHGPEAFGKAEWSEEHLRRERQDGRRVRQAAAALAERLGTSTPLDHDRLTLALVGLPLAVVRPHLHAGSELPAHAEELAERGAIDLLRGGA